MYVISETQLRACLPIAPDETVKKYLVPINHTLSHWDINTSRRVSVFLAQIFHESGHLAHTVENLNYSADGLLKIFGKYFTWEQALQYSRKPEKIANRVYANRMGNGDEASGDGWKHRGRGLIQITGKNMQEAVMKALELTDLAQLSEPYFAALSAGWFWNLKNLSNISDTGTLLGFRQVTYAINGGYNGIDDRVINWERIKKVLV